MIGAGNRLLSDGPYNYAYDANGNMVSQTNISTGAATSVAFDPMNRLLGVVATNASGQITLSVAYSYDLQGDLLSRTAKYYNNGTLTSTNISDFVFDPVSGNVVLAFNGSGALTDRYLYGPAVDELLADERVSSLSSAGTNLWTAIDNEGSVRDVWEDGVGLVDHIVYNSFGAITSQTNSYDAPLIGYTGSFTDPDTGLQWHNQSSSGKYGRWYDPKTQQWIGQDPDGLAPDSNPYRYVGNNPTNGTDPSGLADEPDTGMLRLDNSIFTNGAANEAPSAQAQSLRIVRRPYIGGVDAVGTKYCAAEVSGYSKMVLVNEDDQVGDLDNGVFVPDSFQPVEAAMHGGVKSVESVGGHMLQNYTDFADGLDPLFLLSASCRRDLRGVLWDVNR